MKVVVTPSCKVELILFPLMQFDIFIHSNASMIHDVI